MARTYIAEVTRSSKTHKRRRFSDEFEREAVELSRNTNTSQKAVCEQLGVSPNLLSRWRRELLDDGNEVSTLNEAALGKKIKRLEAELAKKDAEVRFLKRAREYFARNSKSEE